jgi:hypothetical protein
MNAPGRGTESNPGVPVIKRVINTLFNDMVREGRLFTRSHRKNDAPPSQKQKSEARNTRPYNRWTDPIHTTRMHHPIRELFQAIGRIESHFIWG